MSTRHLAAYGTLMLREVMTALLGRLPGSEPILLRGYSRYGVRGQVYPGLVADPSGAVDGLLFFDLDEREMAILDRFEDDFYERAVIEVPSSRGPVAARLYPVPPKFRHLLEETPWEPTIFKERHLAAYLENIGRLV
jgi:gamma-glutamylcyclotransferase (GGCT)/AIG2-like uncharacterized protein YtfP